jgi:membrane-associated phospholipid phosphatase
MASVLNIHLLMNPNSINTIAGRLKSEWVLKLILLIVLNPLVYGPYLFLQHHHFFQTTTMPLSVIDRLIPFMPQTVWIYLSIDILMPIGPLLMGQRRQLLRYATGIILIGLVADVVFLFWPTSCPRPDKTGANALYQAVVSIDNSFHAFPSLHAAFAIYSALCGGMVVRELNASRTWQIVFWLWAFFILLATLTTKQHVLADIMAGSVLGLVAYLCVFSEWIFNRTKKSVFQPAPQKLTQPNSNMP